MPFTRVKLRYRNRRKVKFYRRKAVMEHIQDGSYVEVIKNGRVGEVISRKRSNVIVSFCDKSLIHPEDLTFKESELKVVELPKIRTSELRANAEAAYFYYLQADYAIRKRIDSNYYGDAVVFAGIQKALEETRKEFVDKGRTVKFFSPGWTKWTLIKHRRCRLTIKELNDGVLALDATPLKRRDEEAVPQMLITVPRADYCELRKSIRIKTAPEAKYEIYNGESEIVFDSVEYDWSEKKTSFFLYDDLVGEIWTEYFTFTAPGKKKTELSGEIYHVVSVVFEGRSRCFDYICDDKSIKVGDIVIVNGYDGETQVRVVAVADKYERELVLPVERYKKVVRKGG